MKRVCSLVLCGLLVVSIALASVNSAHAILPFKKEFDNLYVKPEGTDSEKALATAAQTAKCDVCHMGEKKKDRNAYGQSLKKLLDKKEDAKNVAKIQAALKKVEAEPSDPKDPKSPTFGDLIKAGKLPGAVK